MKRNRSGSRRKQPLRTSQKARLMSVSAPEALAPSEHAAQELADAVVSHSCHRARNHSLNAYLVALAAWSRGLAVTFHYELASLGHRFGEVKENIGAKGALFSLSDGERTHVFQNTLGDRTPGPVAVLLKDKYATKQALLNAGCRSPLGAVLERAQRGQAEKFVQRPGLRRFVVKPYSGSLARGVYADLDAEQAVACVQDHESDRLILEQFVPGPEYRVAVVGDQVVGVFEKRTAQVVGDGRRTVAQLIEEKNKQRRQNPHLANKLISVDGATRELLAAQDMALDRVPEADQVVRLSTMASVVRGGEARDCTDSFPETFRAEAVAAAQALGVPNCGMDVIVSEEDGQMYILEVNARAHISGHAFVSEGGPWTNRVAEAIVDWYFPESVNWPRHPKASFDMQVMMEGLTAGVAQQMSLPVLKADWVHKRLQIATENADVSKKVRSLLVVHGVYGSLLKSSRGIVCDLWGLGPRVKAFEEALNAAAKGKGTGVKSKS